MATSKERGDASGTSGRMSSSDCVTFVPQPHIRNVRTLLRRAIGTDAPALELEFIDLLFDNLCCLYIKSMRHAHRDAGIAALLGCRHLDAL